MYQNSLEYHSLLQYLKPLIPSRINFHPLRDNITPVENHTKAEKKDRLTGFSGNLKWTA